MRLDPSLVEGLGGAMKVLNGELDWLGPYVTGSSKCCIRPR